MTAYLDGQPIGYGSGLLMALYVFGPGDERFAAAVVTNKHVVEGSDFVEFQVATDGGPSLTNRSQTKSIVQHPDSEVDLCLIPVAPQLMQAGAHLGEFLSSRDVWRRDRLQELTAIESVIMIGYPNGLIDTHGLYPIARRGVTATPVFTDLHGASDFMIDCACFPGSSGSPVFLLDQGVYVDRSNNAQFGHRFGLLGFLHAGPTLDEKDHLVSRRPPKKLSEMVEAPLMMNLGVCVRAERIFDMFDQLRSLAEPS